MVLLCKVIALNQQQNTYKSLSRSSCYFLSCAFLISHPFIPLQLPLLILFANQSCNPRLCLSLFNTVCCLTLAQFRNCMRSSCICSSCFHFFFYLMWYILHFYLLRNRMISLYLQLHYILQCIYSWHDSQNFTAVVFFSLTLNDHIYFQVQFIII